ncbi:MAG: efflux RND transporter permease subunit [Clostridiales bacterium]|jgi:HAE1 family hydrophobic/amphiphilic exporter-1|nr:efflux RND transporter permease subunit [Eubacteriales bacterium]MDH7565744.1 efflux RND transporter permease subunit [Clostridiales bacterium]
MNITEMSVKRPTAIIMAVVLFISLGVIGYTSLGANLIPEANTPILSIVTTYPGAGSQEIEKDVVKPIEDAVAGINGIDKMRSYAGDGYGYTILQFKMSVDTNAAFIDIQTALDGIAAKLPEDADKPVVHKFDINTQPMLVLSISGASSYEELYSEADRVKRAVEKVKGVGTVTLEGALEKELSIKLDKAALEYYGIGTNTVLARLKAENLNIPAGQVKQDKINQTVRVLGEFQDVNEVKDLLIPLSTGGSIRLGEVARVSMEYPEEKELLRLNGNTSIGIFIKKQSDANIVETANLVKKEIDSISKTLLPGVKLVIATDATTFINASLDETKRNVVEGVITTAIVLFLFLRRWRSSLIVLVAIPTSLITTFFMMYVFNFTFNIVSLLGLTVCIGILVDDSIVVLENISRHIQMGEDPKKAVIEGRMEIGMAAVAITLCDVVVFSPMAFMKDIVGQFFKEFGLTVVFATLFSLFISFTLTPMLAYYMYRGSKKEKVFYEPDENKNTNSRFTQFFENQLKPRYKKFLNWALDNRWKIIGLVAAGVLASVLLIPLKLIDTEFIPGYDQGKLVIDLKLSAGSSLKQTDEKAKLVENHLKEMPEVEDYLTTVGEDNDISSANIIVKLKDKNERKKSQNELARELRAWGKQLTGMDFSVTEQSIVEQTSIDGSKPVIINITGSDQEVLRQISTKVEDVVKSVQGVVDVDNSMVSSQPEICVRIDRLAAAEYGVTAYDVATALRTAIEGTKAGVYRKSGNEYDIYVQFADGQIKTTYDVGSVKILNSMGQQVSVSQVAQVYLSDSPQEILRIDRQQAVTISANMQGRALGSINKEIGEKLKSVALPYGYEIKFGGDQSNMSSSFDSLIKALIASILLVYMILVVLYESFLTPIIRMMSLPCGIIGALVALAITGKSLNILSLIGLIMLDGLVSKNGTLLIDYTNTLMKRGLPLREALLEAGVTRLRPIIMTSVTMIVGMLPMALSLGHGSELKSGMAAVLIGGMATSTLLSPVLLPVVYTLIDDLRNYSRRKKSKTGTGAAEIGKMM